jgi:hypothetical protein
VAVNQLISGRIHKQSEVPQKNLHQ